MRVIGQDGMIDVPYEISTFSFGYKVDMSKFNIYIRSKFLNEKPLIIATYSTKEKAMKAMEMMREKYLSRMELGGGYDITNGHYVQPNFWVLPRVFQFPKDEEIEA